MGVSKNNGTPKSCILIGFSIINHPFWGTPHFWKHPYMYINMTYIYQVLAWWVDTNYISIYGVMILSGIQERFVTHLGQKHIYAKHTSVSIVLRWTLSNGKSHCLKLYGFPAVLVGGWTSTSMKLSNYQCAVGWDWDTPKLWIGHHQLPTVLFLLPFFLAWLEGSGKESFLSRDDLVCSVCRFFLVC